MSGQSADCSDDAADELLDDVDLWELNHVVCRETGNETLCQTVWWRFEFHWAYGWSYYAVSWRMANVTGDPVKVDGVWIGRFRDKDGTRRMIRARMFLETFELFDPELADRYRLPEDKRTGLKKGR